LIFDCLPNGRFAIGSGNTVANYVPVENYIIMLEESLNWKG
jgi:uroporphyrinogen decarboxylase